MKSIQSMGRFGRRAPAALISNAMLLCASSWKAPTRVMNPSVRQSVIDEAYEADSASASAEYGAEFRTDIESFISREVVDAAVILGRFELPRIEGVGYVAFCDPSGGSSDSMTLSIAHMEGERAILDLARERKPPFSPESVVKEFADAIKSYGIATSGATDTAGCGQGNGSQFMAWIINSPARPRATFISRRCRCSTAVASNYWIILAYQNNPELARRANKHRVLERLAR